MSRACADQSDILYTAQQELPVAQKREVVYYDELEEESAGLAAHNLAANQTINSGTRGGDKLYAVLYTSGSTGMPKVIKVMFLLMKA